LALDNCSPYSFLRYEVSNIFGYSLKLISPNFYGKVILLSFKLIDDPISAFQDLFQSLISLKYQLNRSSSENFDIFKNSFNTFGDNFKATVNCARSLSLLHNPNKFLGEVKRLKSIQLADHLPSEFSLISRDLLNCSATTIE
jgi:hypothetical protein